MALRTFAAAFLLALAGAAAQPLPELRIEPIGGGTVFYVKNAASQPVTAFLIELVNYPGSSYTLWQDEAAHELIAPGAEKRIQTTNMTVGAVPDYVKVQAALFADGTSAGLPEKIAELVDRRRSTLTATRELIAKIEKGATATDLKQWADSLAPQSKRVTPATIASGITRSVISQGAASLTSRSKDETLAALRATEHSLAASKPAL